MVRVRPPPRLQDGALAAWLRALDDAARRGEGARAPLRAPPALLGAALGAGGAGLREAVVARLAVAAVAAGVAQLDITLEHPTLLEAVMEAMLGSDLTCLTCLALRLSPRTPLGPHLGPVLQAMTGLTTLTLTPVATDQHLAALATAAPPLASLVLAYCPAVTDAGVRALLGGPHNYRQLKDVLQKEQKELKNTDESGIANEADTTENGCDPGVGATLQQVNLWGTVVTTRGCLALLAGCPALTCLTCQWAGEALEVLGRGGRERPLALTHLLLAETSLPPLQTITTLCPNMVTLVVRRPPGQLGLNDILTASPALTNLTILQYQPGPGPLLPSTPLPAITSLHLSLLEPRAVDLAALATTLPSLTSLTLEGITPILPSFPYILPSLPFSFPSPPSSTPTSPVSTPSSPPSTPTSPDLPCALWPPPPTAPALESLRLATPPTSAHVLTPRVAVWAAVWALSATSIDLASCPALTDTHLAQALGEGALAQVEDLRLTGASKVTDEGILDLIASCPCLRRLALKMLPRERLAQLETLKVDFRTRNLDLELITYGWKF